MHFYRIPFLDTGWRYLTNFGRAFLLLYLFVSRNFIFPLWRNELDKIVNSFQKNSLQILNGLDLGRWKGIEKLIACIMRGKVINESKFEFHLWREDHFDKIESKI